MGRKTNSLKRIGGRIDALESICANPELLEQYKAARASLDGSSNETLRSLIEVGRIGQQIRYGRSPTLGFPLPEHRDTAFQLLESAPG